MNFKNKIHQTLVILVLTTTALISCKKKDNDKRDYYLTQSRDSLLVGKFKLLLEDATKIQYSEFKATGERIFTSEVNGETHTNATDYWYTKGDNLFTLSAYNKAWDKGTYETQWKYWFSTQKDTLFIDINTKDNPSSSINIYIRQ